MTEYHVSSAGEDTGDGSVDRPFATIGRAARIARPGDIVTVHEGVYREEVDPRNGGLSENERIVYRAAEGEGKPVIKGSERLQGWVRLDGHPTVWRAAVPNALFGDFNPFKEVIFGDWLESPKRGEEPDKHLGDVYLNGRSFYEVPTVEDTFDPRMRTEVEDYALKTVGPVLDPDQTRYVWHAEVDEAAGTTTIWANFQDADPNEEFVEISVRRTCFFPSRHHVNYITVRGFEMAQATGDWAPPTAQQWGMVGPNWAYGWIIEDNVLHDAKFSAVSLGKELSSGDNEWARTERKTGYQYQLESVFKALRIGWRKGVVGSHIVRNNHIYDCGQNAIVGHMGCAFSRIEHNRIRRIAQKHEFFGWEVAGIKFHAAIDTVIDHNDIADCSLGLWMDWQTQGTRISRNIMHRNVRDMMIEVSHGPYLVDDNIFASPVTFQNWSQGGAFVNNLICGAIDLYTVPDRSTPYHFPHSTEVAGCAVVSGGDDRYRGNVFAPQWEEAVVGAFGLASYAEHPNDMRGYLDALHAMWADPSQGGGERNPLQPLYAAHNVYCGRVDDSGHERAVVHTAAIPVRLEEDGGTLTLVCDVPDGLSETRVPVTGSKDLPVPRIVEERFESPDGADIVLDIDLLGRPCQTMRTPGPIDGLPAGKTRIVVWEW
ncbi:hypothetical protein BLEM_0560 [Bifidobacterium lemurum]|uniref:Right handed beta helix region n=1 Tax=Bifidobacterium lemurum TaxID=1603886 RepID=A0A261FUN2_9BIFI|nr:right-handed parallel beta-helix repeat-containing protein [Bifidobacterium lemurum]OZG62643.1 hypothetical protein BLEM_0560 [Bifidobacterium lemurum]QOL34635.1 right-handed parallel beta-helix repeat-containing protein [Bifidobacterium lemurum]